MIRMQIVWKEGNARQIQRRNKERELRLFFLRDCRIKQPRQRRANKKLREEETARGKKETPESRPNLNRNTRIKREKA